MDKIIISLKLVRRTILQLLALGAVIHVFQIFVVPSKIDPSLKPYYQSFLQEAQLRNKGFIKHINISVTFSDKLPAKNLGICMSILGMQPTVQINAAHWQKMNETQKEMTVYHELAHCLLLKGHAIEGVAHQDHSLMRKSLFAYQSYDANREKYLQELFGYQPYHATSFVVTFFNLEPQAKKMFDIELSP